MGDLSTGDLTRRVALGLLGLAYKTLVPVVVALERYHGQSLLPLPPPYAYVQSDLVANLGKYLHRPAADVRRIVIVGAWHGHEIRELLVGFRECRVLALEPSREAFVNLTHRWGGEPRVDLLNIAASNASGRASFREMSLTGNGSLLPLAAAGEGTFLTPGVKEIDAYEVSLVRLDALPELAEGAIDCLWIDVQGLELRVLEGAEGVVDRVRSVFLEVATAEMTYEGGARFADLHSWLSDYGFRLASLGTDPVNGQGNALWLR